MSVAMGIVAMAGLGLLAFVVIDAVLALLYREDDE